MIKVSTIDKDDALKVCVKFMGCNAGDEAIEDIVLAIFSQLFDCSVDVLIEELAKSSDY